MKVRNGFVSNSSSSSFIVWKYRGYSFLKQLTEEQAEESIKRYKESDDFIDWVYEEFLDFFKKEKKIESTKEQIACLMNDYCDFVKVNKYISVAHVTIKQGGDGPSWEDMMVDWFREDLFKNNFKYLYQE